MRRLLIVAYYFPPTAASGSMRPLGFCRHLEAQGWQARVLSTDEQSMDPSLQSDAGLLRQVPPSVVVHRVPHRDPLRSVIELRDRLFRRRRAERVDTAAGPGASTPRRSTWRGAMKESALQHAFAFPDQQVSWHAPAVRHGLRMLAEEPADAILATGKPWTGLNVGVALSKATNTPLIVDFRDPWIRNPYGEWASPSLLRRAERLELQICAHARWVLANTEELREQFVADYPEMAAKFVTLANGFDDLTGDAGDGASPIVGPPRRGVELWHFGTVYGKRDPVLMLRALRHLHDQGAITPDRMRLRFVGSWLVTDPASNEVALDLEGRGFLTREARVPHAECLRQMQAAPALLVLQPASPLQIPAKIYEYVATGRPLLLVGGEGATARLVQRHGLGMCCPNSPDDVMALLRNLAVSGHVPAPAAAASQAFHYRNLTRRLVEHLDDAVGGARAAVPVCA